jgi:two-component system, NarL family, response regulator DevR
MSAAMIKVLLVDDHEMVRTGLRVLLGGHSRFRVVGGVGSAAEALMAVRKLQPDVVLLDLRLKVGSGIEVCRQLRKEGSAVRILILTSYASDDLLAEAIDAGADGYVLKDVDGAHLTDALLKVAQGENVFDPGAAKRLVQRMKGGSAAGPSASTLAGLSAQECRVLEIVARGKTNKEIASDLGLSDKTVKNYLSNLMGKLGVSRRAEAVAIYLRVQARSSPFVD